MKINNKGMTLVEVIVGFLLLVVIMTTFIKIINLSSELTSAALDSKKDKLEFESKYYDGVNYPVTNGSTSTNAFRETGTDIFGDTPIVLTEVKKDNNGKFQNNDNAVAISFTNIKLILIENLNDRTISRMRIFRYVKQ